MSDLMHWLVVILVQKIEKQVYVSHCHHVVIFHFTQKITITENGYFWKYHHLKFAIVTVNPCLSVIPITQVYAGVMLVLLIIRHYKNNEERLSMTYQIS
jgi:hypothetical protein